jgi:hypothetical protein
MIRTELIIGLIILVNRNHCDSASSGQMTVPVIVRKRAALCDLLIKTNFS